MAARDLRDELNKLEIWGGKLKTVVLRASEAEEVVAALFIKEELDMSSFKLPASLKGLDIYYSNPKSPASVASKKLYSFGDIKLNDKILGINITYDVMSFFQVNIPVFELALEQIKLALNNKSSVDVYSGVGTIGIVVGSSALVETDKSNVEMAKLNASEINIDVVEASAEDALKYIVEDKVLIVDPPRAGLHRSVVDKIAEVRPTQIIYLSCNPSTQARDVKLLENQYKVSYAQGFNFFPRTPHIESLIVLERL
jgi:23S rRNA (uracil1939-C5)-methyltransferase